MSDEQKRKEDKDRLKNASDYKQNQLNYKNDRSSMSKMLASPNTVMSYDGFSETVEF